MDKQIWIIEGQLVYQGGYAPLPDGGQASRNLCFAFYNERTGEVWGKRIGPGGNPVWLFLAADFPYLRLPYEELAGFLPDSYFDYLTAFAVTRQGLTNSPVSPILPSNNPNSTQGIT